MNTLTQAVRSLLAEGSTQTLILALDNLRRVVEAQPIADRETVAFVAIGAARLLDTRRSGDPRTDEKLDAHEGELGLIRDVLHDVHLLDILPAGCEWAGVHAYEVAEEYGARVAARLLDDAPLDRQALIDALIRGATQGESGNPATLLDRMADALRDATRVPGVVDERAAALLAEYDAQ